MFEGGQMMNKKKFDFLMKILTDQNFVLYFVNSEFISYFSKRYYANYGTMNV